MATPWTAIGKPLVKKKSLCTHTTTTKSTNRSLLAFFRSLTSMWCSLYKLLEVCTERNLLDWFLVSSVNHRYVCLPEWCRKPWMSYVHVMCKRTCHQYVQYQWTPSDSLAPPLSALSLYQSAIPYTTHFSIQRTFCTLYQGRCIHKRSTIPYSSRLLRSSVKRSLYSCQRQCNLWEATLWVLRQYLVCITCIGTLRASDLSRAQIMLHWRHFRLKPTTPL